MQHNSTTSPLLHLPSEIRNRIFKLVFSLPERPCVRFLGDEHQAIAVPGQSESVHFGGYLHLTQPFHPWGTRSLHLQVLRVCRQIYAEAALLPYASNKFSCESPQALEEFERKLKPVQRQPIKEPICVGHGAITRHFVKLGLSGRIWTAPSRYMAMPNNRSVFQAGI